MKRHRENSELCSWTRRTALALLIAASTASGLVRAQDGTQEPAPAQTEPDSGDEQAAPIELGPPEHPDLDASSEPLVQYSDPAGRFSFVIPALWTRRDGESPDEVAFQSDEGDSIRVSVEPLAVSTKAFESAYVDTYLKVLAQSFTNVKFVGQRPFEINYRKAVDYTFTGLYGTSPVVCHQIVVFCGDKVLYVTFAGFGSNRSHAEQLFTTSLVSFWLSPTFGGPSSVGVGDPNAPPFVIAIPEGWRDEGAPDANTHIFRPLGARRTSAFISTRVAKLEKDSKLQTIDDTFVSTYSETLRKQHPPEAYQLYQTRKIFAGNEVAVRYDYGYVSNYGIRRAILLLSIHDGYIVAVACDAPEQTFVSYQKVFEALVTGFRFKDK